MNEKQLFQNPKWRTRTSKTCHGKKQHLLKTDSINIFRRIEMCLRFIVIQINHLFFMIFQLFASKGRFQIVCFVRYQFRILNANVWITTIWNIPNIWPVRIIWLNAIILCWYVIGYALLISLHFFFSRKQMIYSRVELISISLYCIGKTVFRLQIWKMKNKKGKN